MKNHHHNHPVHPHKPAHEDIALCAFTLWIDYGRPENRHEAIWLEAEKQLIEKKLQEARAPTVVYMPSRLGINKGTVGETNIPMVRQP
jgi:hypothetical protein